MHVQQRRSDARMRGVPGAANETGRRCHADESLHIACTSRAILLGTEIHLGRSELLGRAVELHRMQSAQCRDVKSMLSL
jgi:hypothetical protein